MTPQTRPDRIKNLTQNPPDLTRLTMADRTTVADRLNRLLDAPTDRALEAAIDAMAPAELDAAAAMMIEREQLAAEDRIDLFGNGSITIADYEFATA